MKRFLNAALAVLGLTGSITLGHADDLPVLRSQVMTLSEIVTVGDFYSNSGPFASKPLFRSPDMGTSGNVSAKTVAERARAAGLEDAGTDGLRTVVVHRGAAKFDRDRLVDMIAAAITKRNADLNRNDLEIKLQRAPEQVLADPKVQDPVRIDRVDWSRSTGQFTVSATVAVEFGTETLTITGVATEMMEVVALAQPIRRGSIVSENDLTKIRRAKRSIQAGALRSGESIVGMAAKTALRANSPLLKQSFEMPILVERGEKITVTFQTNGMKLTSRAQALENGAKGDVIDVMNLQSRRIVPATIISRGHVRVHAANPLLASLNNETN